MYPEQTRTRILAQISEGFPITDVAAQEHIPPRTIQRWIKQYGVPSLGTEDTIANLKLQLGKLAKCRQTVAVAHKIAMLTNSLTKLETLHLRDEKKRIAKRHKPRVQGLGEEEIKALRERALSDEYGLYQYQRDFMASDAQFRIVLKARQIGFSYVAGLDALIMAAAGRSQLFLSASEEQSIILMRYVTMHAERLGIVVEGGDKELKLASGAVIKAMAHNFRTVQGFTGDIWMDDVDFASVLDTVASNYWVSDGELLLLAYWKMESGKYVYAPIIARSTGNANLTIEHVGNDINGNVPVMYDGNDYGNFQLCVVGAPDGKASVLAVDNDGNFTQQTFQL